MPARADTELVQKTGKGGEIMRRKKDLMATRQMYRVRDWSKLNNFSMKQETGSKVLQVRKRTKPSQRKIRFQNKAKNKIKPVTHLKVAYIDDVNAYVTITIKRESNQRGKLGNKRRK